MSLPISNVVNVNVSITPSSPPKIGFGIAGVVSSELQSNSQPAELRITYFNTIDEVNDVYLSTTEVSKIANAYFSQSPAPDIIGVIAQYLTPTNAILFGGTSVNSDIAMWQGINDGSFEIGIGSVLLVQVPSIDFSSITTMDQVAAAIQASLIVADASLGFTAATVVWDGFNNRFIITSGEVAQTIAFTSTGITGTDISPLMETEVSQGGYLESGRGPETALDALNAASDFDQNWYGILLVKSLRDTQEAEDIAAWTEARVKIFAATTNNPNTLIAGNVDNIAARISASNFTRTTLVYSSSSDEYPEAAMLGKAFTVDFNAPLSVITLKFKRLSGITSENITSSQKGAIDTKRANAYISIGGADMFSEGFMASQLFFDERHGVDWLVGELEFNLFAYLLGRPTKVALTDAGTSSVVQQAIKVLDSARRNGLIAAGTTSDSEFLPNGYKITAGKISDLPIADKNSRILPTINFVALLSGAAHFIEVRGILER